MEERKPINLHDIVKDAIDKGVIKLATNTDLNTIPNGIGGENACPNISELIELNKIASVKTAPYEKKIGEGVLFEKKSSVIFNEDIQYLLDDFTKLKSNIVYKRDLPAESLAFMIVDYEEKLQRFQKRYGNIIKSN